MLTPVVNDRDIQVITRLSEAIFLEYYGAAWGKNSVHKLLKHSFSQQAVSEEIQNSTTHYFLIAPYLDAVGYVAVIIRPADLTITQFYISWHYRHKGYGDAALKELEILARGSHKEHLSVRLDGADTEAIAFFEKRGFTRGEILPREVLPGITILEQLLTKNIKPLV